MNPEELMPILQQAKTFNFLRPKLDSNACFVKYINTANRLLYFLFESGSLSTSQIVARSGMHKNTCVCYCRELERLGVIQREDAGQQETIWYFQENKPEIRNHVTRQEIVNFLESNPGWHTTKEIADAIGITRRHLVHLADELRRTGRLEKETNLGRGNQNRYRV